MGWSQTAWALNPNDPNHDLIKQGMRTSLTELEE